MKAQRRKLIGSVAIAFMASTLGSMAANAESLKEQVVGTWVAVSQYVDQDGKKLEPLGSSPKGMVVYDASGRFVLVLQRGSLPKFASNNRMNGSPVSAVGGGIVHLVLRRAK